LDEGQLSGAALDVFPREPLTGRHAFWQHSKLLVVAHVASLTHLKTAVAAMVEDHPPP